MTSPAPKSNLVAGGVAAVVGALLGAVAWAVLVSVTDYKIGFAAIGVGALAGVLAGKAGGGHPALPVVAGAVGLLGCVIGDLLIDAHAVSKFLTEAGEPVSSFDIITKSFGDLIEFYKAAFEPFDALFYALAALFGFRLATQFGAQAAMPATPWEPPTTGTWAAPTTDTDTDAGTDTADATPTAAGDAEITEPAVTDEVDPPLAGVAAAPVEAPGESLADELPAPPVTDQGHGHGHDHPHPH